MTDFPTYTIGDLAEKTGVTVRTLQYYDERGLLSPVYRSPGDHRLYTGEDIAKLQQILSLKQLGFSLDDIGAALTNPAFSPEKVLGMHLARIQEQIKLQSDLQERLEGMQRFLQSRGTLTTDEFLTAIKLMQDVESTYTEEERESIRQQGEKLGKEKMIAVENEWPQLMADMKKLKDEGTNPADPAVQQLATRWKELVEMFTGGNPAIAAKLKKMYTDNPDAGKTFGGPGFDASLMEYVQKAWDAQA